MKIAVLLPPKADVGSIRRARALSAALVDDAVQQRHGPVHVAVGLPDGDPAWQVRARMIADGLRDVVVRAVAWESLAARQVARMFPLVAAVEDLDPVAIPKDWGWNFADCDAWIVFGDGAVGGVAHLKPTAVYCRDLAARYVPESYAPDMRSPLWDRQTEAFQAWRQVECVFATDPATLDDVVGYAGVERSRTRLLPPFWALYDDLPPSGARTDLGDAILWLTEPTPGHDIETVIEAVRRYVRLEGGLRLVIAGEHVSALDPRRGQSNLGSLALARAPEVLARTWFETVALPGELDALIAGAGVVWSSAVAEGESDAAPIAARHARPLMACDTPQSHRASHLLKAPTHLYRPGDVEGALVALLGAQAGRQQPGAVPGPAGAEFPPGMTRGEVVASYVELIDALLAHVPA